MMPSPRRDAVTDQLLIERDDKPRPVGWLDTQPQPQATLRFGRVVELLQANGAAWTSYAANLQWPHRCTINPSNARGNQVQTSVSLAVVLNHQVAFTASVPTGLGTGIITAVDQIIAYMPTTVATSNGTVIAQGMVVPGYGSWADYTRILGVAS